MRSRQSRGRENHRKAKRYAADPVYRQKKKAQNKALRDKRYAEDAVFRQMKRAREAKRNAEDPVARQE